MNNGGKDGMNNGQNPIKHWQELQKSLIQQMPLPAGSTGIDKFVHKAIKNFMQHSLPHQAAYPLFSAENEVECDLFESQRTIFVRCKVPNEASKRVRFFANKNKLKIDYSGNIREILLPSDVQPVRSFARMDGDVVEVLLPKTRDAEPFHEILIRE